METLIQITGVQYACNEADVGAVMSALERQKPEVLLVTEQTHDFGIIVRALVGTAYRGVVSRFDLEHVLCMMQHNGTSVLVGRVTDTDCEGRCYNISVSGDYPTPSGNPDDSTSIWTEWQWTGAPLMDSNPEDCRLDISLKVVLAELRRSGSMNKQTLLEHLALILQLAQWDVCQETQQQLSQIRQMVNRHADSDVRALAPKLRRTLTALGSKERIGEFQSRYLPMLCQSAEAGRMHQQWCLIHNAELSDVKQWEPTITRQLDVIEESLLKLPADLYYQKDTFGELMHRLLYLSIPRRKLLMLLSALVLRKQLRRQLGLDEEGTGNMDENERQLILRLAPIFNGNTDNAREFLLLTREMNPLDITHLVNLWVMEKRISYVHCHRPLWTVLHDAGIYTLTEANWNIQLNVRKAWR